MKKLTILILVVYCASLQAMDFTKIAIGIITFLIPHGHYAYQKVQSTARQSKSRQSKASLTLYRNAALANAVYNQQYEGAEWLLKQGANPTIKQFPVLSLIPHASSCLELAIRKKDISMLTLLLDHTPMDQDSKILYLVGKLEDPMLMQKYLSQDTCLDAPFQKFTSAFLTLQYYQDPQYQNITERSRIRSVLKALTYAGIDTLTASKDLLKDGIDTCHPPLKEILENPLAIKQYCTADEIKELDAMMEERRIAVINQHFAPGTLFEQLHKRMIQ